MLSPKTAHMLSNSRGGFDDTTIKQARQGAQDKMIVAYNNVRDILCRQIKTSAKT